MRLLNLFVSIGLTAVFGSVAQGATQLAKCHSENRTDSGYAIVILKNEKNVLQAELFQQTSCGNVLLKTYNIAYSHGGFEHRYISLPPDHSSSMSLDFSVGGNDTMGEFAFFRAFIDGVSHPQVPDTNNFRSLTCSGKVPISSERATPTSD